MREEILMAKGRLGELKGKRRELSLEGKALVLSIRAALDPFEPDVARLRIGEAKASLQRLVEIHHQLIEIDRAIAEIEAALS